MIKRVITVLFSLFVMFASVISNNSFLVFADNDISTWVTSDTSVSAWQYWFNQGLTDYTVYSTDGTTTTYTGTIENASHNISHADSEEYNPVITYTPSSSTSDLKWQNYSTTSYPGMLTAQSSNSTINLNSSGNPTSFRLSAQYIGLGDLKLSNTGYKSQAYYKTISHGDSTVAKYNSTLKNFTSSEPSTLKSITSNNYISGYTSISSYTSSRRFNINANSPYYISFFANVNISASDLQIFQNGTNANINVTRLTIMPMNAGYNKLTFKFTTDKDVAICVNWVGMSSSTKVRPVFNGPENILTDDVAQFLGIDTETERLLKSIDNNLYQGGAGTQTSKDNNNFARNNFNNVANQYHNIESNNISNMSTQLNSIGTNNNLYSINGFINATQFVSTQFMNLINLDTSTAISSMIVFSLILGVALTIIGKLRN